MVYYLTSPYSLPFLHGWEIRRARGWEKEQLTGRESERHWENWRFAGWETAREWKGNEEEISVIVVEGAPGSFALPPSARTGDEWLVILCLLAFTFSKATTRDTIPLQRRTHTSHKAHNARNILNVSEWYRATLAVILMQRCSDIQCALLKSNNVR